MMGVSTHQSLVVFSTRFISNTTATKLLLSFIVLVTLAWGFFFYSFWCDILWQNAPSFTKPLFFYFYQLLCEASESEMRNLITMILVILRPRTTWTRRLTIWSCLCQISFQDVFLIFNFLVSIPMLFLDAKSDNQFLHPWFFAFML